MNQTSFREHELVLRSQGDSLKTDDKKIDKYYIDLKI